MRTPLGSVIGRMKVEPAYPEDDVIDDDLILVWGEEKRIITGAALLGRLLRAILTQDATENRLANSFSRVGGQGPDHVRGGAACAGLRALKHEPTSSRLLTTPGALGLPNHIPEHANAHR